MKNKRWLRYLPAGLGALVILLVALGVYVFRDFFKAPVTGKKAVQQVSVVQPPPPPPPPPQPEVKPPEPEVKEEKIEEPEPEPEPEPQQEPESSEPPPGADLGVDAEGGGAGDAFGLVGKKGGRSFLESGTGNGTGNGTGTGRIGGNGGQILVSYGQLVGQKIQDELHRNLKDKARSSSYSAVVHLWINPDGSIGRVELANSSGTEEIDEALKVALRGIHDRFQPPPEKLPQPLKIRIRS